MLVPEIAFDMADLEHAAELVYRVLPPTPQYAWPKLKQRAGCTVWVKHENHTPTGAFKVRGGVVYLERLRHAQPMIPGVITATRGNHGQSIAFAAARTRVPATIFVPRGNSPDQNSAIAAFGADVLQFGREFDQAKHQAFRGPPPKGAFRPPLSIKTSSSALRATRSSCFARWDRWIPYTLESGWARESRDCSACAIC